MKAVALQKAVNVIKMDSWTSPADFRYQDETSQFKIGCDRGSAQRRREVYVPRAWDGLPYLVKDDLGKIYVRGFLHDQVALNPDGTFTHPSTLANGILIDRLSKAWKANARQCRPTQVSHQRLVFSMSKEFHDAIVERGRNPDMVLKGVVERTMRSFQEHFHPGDSVSYSYGLHHDTDNLHAHVFVHPRTRHGAFVGLSEQLQRKNERGAASRHKNQLKFVREAARRRAAQVVRELSDPKAATALRHNFQSDRILFIPRISHIAPNKRQLRPLTPVDAQLEQKRADVVSLDRKIATKRAAIREAASSRCLSGVFRLRQPKWLRNLQAAQTATLYRELRQLQERRYQAASTYWTSRHRSPGIIRATLPASVTSPVETPAVAIRTPKLRPVVKAAVKPTKPQRKIGL